jgi:hypothetical protein
VPTPFSAKFTLLILVHMPQEDIYKIERKLWGGEGEGLLLCKLFKAIFGLHFKRIFSDLVSPMTSRDIADQMC